MNADQRESCKGSIADTTWGLERATELTHPLRGEGAATFLARGAFRGLRYSAANALGAGVVFTVPKNSRRALSNESSMNGCSCVMSAHRMDGEENTRRKNEGRLAAPCPPSFSRPDSLLGAMRLAQKPGQKRTRYQMLFSVICLYGESRISHTGQHLSQNQAPIGSHSRSLEIDLQRSIGRELQWLILFLTQRVRTSQARETCWKPDEARLTWALQT
jgi:hypothetical protein